MGSRLGSKSNGLSSNLGVLGAISNHFERFLALGAFLAPAWPRQYPQMVQEPPEKPEETRETASKRDFGALVVDFGLNF